MNIERLIHDRQLSNKTKRVWMKQERKPQRNCNQLHPMHHNLDKVTTLGLVC